MRAFKDYIHEKLTLTQARNAMQQSAGAYKNLLDHIFKGEDRIYIPLLDVTRNDLKNTPLTQKVRSHIENKGIKIDEFNYLNGYIRSNNQQMKIGKLIKDDFRLSDAFAHDPLRYENGLEIVISRHPIDIAGMSTDRHWSSCMDLNPKPGTKSPGSMIHKIKDDMEQGTIIAYLISKNDHNIERPVSRILIKPFFRQNNPTFAYGTDKSYGKFNETFEKRVAEWVEENLNQGKTGRYHLHPSIYPDTTIRYKQFGEFNVDDFLSDYEEIDGRIIIPHGLYWTGQQEMTELPFKGKKVVIQGDFIVMDSVLQSLEGGPIEVTGDYNVSNNDLKSLKGVPTRIGGSFDCSYNKRITNLLDCKGLFVAKEFDCSNCSIESLNGIQKVISGNFDCALNKLRNFIGGPTIVHGNYAASLNPIMSLEGLARQIDNNLYIAIAKGGLGRTFTDEEVAQYSKVGWSIVSRIYDVKEDLFDLK